MMSKHLLILLLFFAFSTHAKVQIQSNVGDLKVGCTTLAGDLFKRDCRKEQNYFQALNDLYASNKIELEKVILDRAQEYLQKKKFDYFSVLSLMIFPINQKEKVLQQFKKLPGKRAPFTLIALERIKMKEPSECKADVAIYLKEICRAKILP
jgi:hypothetical protein